MPRTVRRWGALGAAVCAAVLVTVMIPPRSAARPPRATTPLTATLAADVAMVRAAEASAQALSKSPGTPACAPPALPTPTYPPGQTYGIPFLAAITGGTIVTGYDEWTANHHVWKVKGKTYILNPWQARVTDITGWATGLLQLPSLSATIAPQDLVFCDSGGEACESASPPAGECIYFSLRGAPVPGAPPSPAQTDIPAPGKPCYQQTKFCIPYVISLTPVGDSQLTVTGVDPDGSLELGVTTSASTSLSFSVPGSSEACQNAPATIALSSQVHGLPAGAPVPPNPGNPDLRGLRHRPAPLTGPLGSATTVVASNDFSVPAFSPSSCPALAAIFDAPLAGWNAKPSQDPASVTNNYFDQTPLPADAGTPGWVQFSATTTISDLGLPVGPPAGFTLAPPAP